MPRSCLLAALLVVFLAAAPAGGVEPDEILDDPALEARARDLSKLLRCVTCQSENIDQSNAPLARDLRLLVRERLKAGDSDQEVIDFVVARYGAYVLLKPPLRGDTVLLWAGPALFALAGAGVLAGVLARRRAPPGPAPLSAVEEREVEELLK